MSLTKDRLLETAQNAIKELEFSEYEHGAILEYLDITEKDYKEIKKTPLNSKAYVYMVQVDYSTDDEDWVETYLFDTIEKAQKKFHELVENEKECNWYNQYDEDWMKENIEIDTNIEDTKTPYLWWNIKCLYNYNLHAFISLYPIEVE